MSAMSKAKTAEAPIPRGVSQPAIRALNDAGYFTLDQLANARESDLAALHGMGPKALGILKTALAQNGRSFQP